MTGWIPSSILGTVAIGYALAADVVSSDHPFGWLGPALIAILGAFSLWRAGSVRAWKETAQGRAERIEDLATEIAGLREIHAAEVSALRVELAIPERIEGIIKLMADSALAAERSAERRAQLAETGAKRRLDDGLSRVETLFTSHTRELLKALEQKTTPKGEA